MIQSVGNSKRWWSWRPWGRSGCESSALVPVVVEHFSRTNAEYQRIRSQTSSNGHPGLVDFLFADPDSPHSPETVFDRLRWGGLFIYVTSRAQDAAVCAQQFRAGRGFVIETQPTSIRADEHRLFRRARRAHYFIARKIDLIQIGQTTDRFTYHVYLTKRPDPEQGWVVCKEIPDTDKVITRLRERFPEATEEMITKNARKLVEKVFPVFLTREAAFLRILQRDLPPEFQNRLPKLYEYEKDANGFVKRMYIQWLRNGGWPITQIEFAKQSAKLLEILHERIGVMHLDLRLDNFVITKDGVGFVDFGSAVRVGEDLTQSPMLARLFDEMMTTSQIQRDLGRMKKTGRVTSKLFCDNHEKVDKAVDLFYLAMQMNDPHANPDFVDLVEFHRGSEETRLLATLTREILQPTDPQNPAYRTATDILNGIERVEAELKHLAPTPAAVPAA
ncbi:MAG: hypothetical protein K8S99_16490 [Planctomycetes bacterium]|nr:hypothetical protein [Planctomycetota bacterium]